MSIGPEKAIPVVRSDGLLVEQVGDETVIYDPERTEAHCLGPLAAAVFSRCDGEASIERIAELVTADLNEPTGIDHVETALAQLEERELVVVPGVGTSRREMLRRTAAVAATAITVPLVTSIVMPTAALAAGGCAIGKKCTSDADCGSTHPSCFTIGTCGCGPCTSGGSSVCSVHGPGGTGKCSAPCTYGGGTVGPPCTNCGT